MLRVRVKQDRNSKSGLLLTQRSSSADKTRNKPLRSKDKIFRLIRAQADTYQGFLTKNLSPRLSSMINSMVKLKRTFNTSLMKPLLREEPLSPTLKKLENKQTESETIKPEEAPSSPLIQPNREPVERHPDATFDQQSFFSVNSPTKKFEFLNQREEAEGSSKKSFFNETAIKEDRPTSSLQKSEHEVEPPKILILEEGIAQNPEHEDGFLKPFCIDQAAQKGWNLVPPQTNSSRSIKRIALIQQAQRQYYLTPSQQNGAISRLAHELITLPNQDPSPFQTISEDLEINIPKANEISGRQNSKQPNRQPIQRMQLRDFLTTRTLSNYPAPSIFSSPKTTRKNFSIKNSPYLFKFRPQSQSPIQSQR